MVSEGGGESWRCYSPSWSAKGKRSGHSIMFADTFRGVQTMVVWFTDPKVLFVLKRAPRSVKFVSVSSEASNKQNCAPSASLPHPTPRYHFCSTLPFFLF